MAQKHKREITISSKILANNLKRYRTKYRLSQEAAAERLEISSRYYGSLERATCSPTLALLDHIADAMGIGINTLLTEALWQN